MRLTPEDTLADMLQKLRKDVDDIQSESDIDEPPVQIRTVFEVETSADTVTATVDTDPGWTWGTSEWGYDIWG